MVHSTTMHSGQKMKIKVFIIAYDNWIYKNYIYSWLSLTQPHKLQITRIKLKYIVLNKENQEIISYVYMYDISRTGKSIDKITC